MKKFKMFGLSLLLMFVGIFSVSAENQYAYESNITVSDNLSIKVTNDQITYTNESGKDFSYQIVKVKTSDFDAIQSDLEELAASLVDKFKKILEAQDSGDEATYEAASNEMIQVLEQMNQKYATVAGYNDSDWINAGAAKSGKIDIDLNDLSDEEDGYFVWIKSDEIPFNNGVMLAASYSKDAIVVIPTVPTDEPSNPDNQKVTATKQITKIQNPKTGVSLPITAGVVGLLGTVVALYTLNRRNLFKRI